MPRPRRRNPWTSTGEVFIWVLFALLLFPIGFAGWAVGHYTSLGKPSATVVHTVTLGSTTLGPTSVATTTSPGTTAASTSATTTSSGGGNAAAGKAVFASNNCASCHTFAPANASGTVGPDLDKAPAADAKADNNMALAAFIKESITNPDAYVPKGYTKGIMPTNFGQSLSSTQLADLVAFILSGTKSSRTSGEGLLPPGLGCLGRSGKPARSRQVGGQPLPLPFQSNVEERVGVGRVLDRPVQARHKTLLALFEGIVHHPPSSS